MEVEGENYALKWFIANRDADYVRKATKGFGTDDDLLVQTLCSRTKAQLDRISTAYNAKFNKSLKKILKSETSGNYCKLVIYSQMTKKKFDALMLYDSMHGLGTNDSLLIEVLTTRTNAELADAKEYFEGKYDTSLVDWVKSETSGHYRDALIKLILEPRPEGDEVNEQLAEAQAHTLYMAGRRTLGSGFRHDKKKFVEILTGSSRAQVRAIKAAYEKQHGYSLEHSIQEKMGGDLKDAMLSLVEEPMDHFARSLKRAFKGLGTDNGAVVRILGGLPKKDALKLAARYEEKYGTSLVAALKSELSFHFKDAAVAWVSAVDPTGGLEPVTEGEDPPLDALHKENHNLKQFIAECDATDIRRACKGLGTDNKSLVNVVCGRTKAQLLRVDAIYRERYGMSLKKQIAKETSGHYGQMVRYALMKKEKLDAELLYTSMHGLGTTDSLLIEVMTTRTNAELQAAKTAFESTYDKSLTDYIRGDTSGDYRKTLLKLLLAERDEREEPDEGLAVQQAHQLYAAGKGRVGTDEAMFIDILTSASRAQVQRIKAVYEKEYGHSLEKAVKSETSGHFAEVLEALLEQPVDFYARALKNAFKGFGTDNGSVARILGANDKAMVEKIAARYQEKYGDSLVTALNSELSFNFKRAAVMWVAGEAPEEAEEDEAQPSPEDEGVKDSSKGGEKQQHALPPPPAAAAAAAAPPVAPPTHVMAPVVQPQPQPAAAIARVVQPVQPTAIGMPQQQQQQQLVYMYGRPMFMPPPPMALNMTQSNPHVGGGLGPGMMRVQIREQPYHPQQQQQQFYQQPLYRQQ